MAIYHVWLSPKSRKPILEGHVAEEAMTALRDVARERRVHMIECELTYDHVHMLIDVQEDQTLSSVMHQLKGASAHRIFQRLPEPKLDLQQTSFWQRGYGYRKLEEGELFRVKQYIRNHREEDERGSLDGSISKPRVSTRGPRV